MLLQAAKQQNLELAFSVLESRFGVPRLLDVEDVLSTPPDERSLMTFVAFCLKTLSAAAVTPKTPRSGAKQNYGLQRGRRSYLPSSA
jgi:hypothetical protein